ncbi:DNA polymerase sigma subunit [Angomonas deanei]|uniref:Nucleotidyltransferase domain/Cid1 family poly A polymerase, putative n=1 Tax=Angomonas deanei TaxID=59799 RepID=A0A7G2C8G9_9TRYP|nr:DNA polymerase sigma subunit [Angomonas deanei]CAD2215879.1 Nucleotidyltransferase domain/Cid1 family poly A polymerase, putative [Angomonas deanei]|eukprot:EPY41981.1 DNA polymerase sigma subunit [Angomonas deanei]
MYLTVEVYGSLRTGLLVPTSDIDCVMKIEDKSKVAYILQRVAYCCGKYKGVQTARESKQAFAGGVRFIGNVLRGSGVFRQVTCIAHAKVPIVKCVHRGDSIKVDLSFEEDGCESSDFLCAQFQKEKFRLARGLIILVKSLLANFSLDDPSVGGLGSFPTSILVLYYLRAVVHEHYPVELRDNMAVIFVGFLKYYGNEQFDYRRECINFREGKTFTKAPSSDLYIENPVKPGTNCSRSATLYASKVVPKFSEAADDFSVLLEQDVKDRQVESVLEEYFGRCIPQVSHWDQVERRAENKPLVPQHQWDPKTNVYIGGVLD